MRRTCFLLSAFFFVDCRCSLRSPFVVAVGMDGGMLLPVRRLSLTRVLLLLLYTLFSRKLFRWNQLCSTVGSLLHFYYTKPRFIYLRTVAAYLKYIPTGTWYIRGTGTYVALFCVLVRRTRSRINNRQGHLIISLQAKSCASLGENDF